MKETVFPVEGFVYWSLERATKPRHCSIVWVDCYWVFHPELGIAFYEGREAPQGHTQKEYVQRWVDDIFPGHTVQKIPVVYV